MMKTPAQHAVMAVLSVGFLVAAAQCRPEAGRTRAPLVSGKKTAVEEGKLYIKFCIHTDCELDGKIYNECGCCALLPPYPKCFKSQEECQAQCPACHPHCPQTPPPPPPSPPPPPPSQSPPPLPPENIFPPLPPLPPAMAMP